MIEALGILRAGGGTRVVYTGAPSTAIRWSASVGTISPELGETNANGVATAYLDASELIVPGTVVAITVEVFANA